MPLSPEALERLNAHLDQRDNDLPQSLARAKRVDPARERQVQPLAQQTGLPRDVVDRNLEETRTRVQFDPLEGMELDSPGTATFMSDYGNAAASSDNVEVMRSLEDKLKPRSGFWANTGKNVIERTNTIVGNLIEAGGVASEDLENFMRDTVGIPNPGIVMGEDGMSWSWDVDTAETPNLMREVGAVASEQGRSGYQPTFTWENFKGDMTAQNLAGYVVETGSASLVDMAATITTLPAYIASRSQEMAEETAQLEGRDPDTVDVGDQLTSLPTAVAVSLIEQYSARGALGFLSDGTSGPAKEIGKAFVREAGTEFVQEQVEYLGTTIPAEGQQVSLLDMLDRGVAGAVAGGPAGGAIRGASLAVESLVTRTEKDLTQQLDSRFEQQSMDEIISDVQRDVLHQESPEKFRELVENIGPNERIYLSPEAVADAVNEGERLPDYLVNQMDGAEDIALTLDQFAMDIVANDNLLQRFRPHMKRKPGSMTQAELEASQGTAVRSMVEKAAQEQETLSEAEAIHREVSEQLVATGRLSQRSANISAELIPAWVTTKVSELRGRGIETTPREVFDKLGLRVERGAAPERGQVMEQAGDVRPPAENLQDVIDSNFTMGRSLGQRTVPVGTLTTRMSEAADDAAAVDQLVEQMQSDEGFIESIIVDTEGNVIEGQHRAEAYRRMGRTEIPAVVIQDMGAAVDAVTATGVRPEQARQVVDEVAAIMGRGDNVSEYDTGGFDAQYQAAEQALSQQGVAESPQQADVLLQGDERGSIELMDDERIIRLADTSDLSTFLHETAHLLLEGERIMAAEYGLSENQEAILDMLDVDSFDNLTTEKHELFARTFEDYLRTGKAPSQRLKDAFAAFSRWLARIYQGIKQLGMNLDEETTAVLDRMLATQTEIESTLEEPAYTQYFRSAEQAGMSDAEWEAYQKRIAKRRNRSESKLLDRVMASYRRKRTREWNEERDILAAEEKVRLSETRAFQMQTFVRKNKLDYDAVAAAREDGQVLGRLLSASQKGGVDPELIAEQFGYDTTQDMLQELQETPTLDQAAEQAAEQKMVRKYGDVLNDGRLEQEVHDAVHNEIEAQRLLDELKVLNRRTRQPAVNLKAIRAEAEHAVESMTLAELDPFRYYRAEVRAARNAESARNAREARDFKMQQLANHYLYRAASQTMKDAQKWRPHLKALKTRNYRASQVDPRYANRLRQIGRMYDARVKPAKRKERALDLMEWLEGQITAGMPVEIHDPVLAEAFVRYKENGDVGDYRIPHIDQLTVAQLRGAYEMSRHLRFVGGKMAEAQSGEMRAKAEGLAESIASHAGRKVQDEVKNGQRIRRELSHAVNLMPSLRNLVRNLDADWDNEGGPAFDLIYQEVARGTNNKLNTHDKFVEDFTRIMDGWDKIGLDEKRATERTVVREDGSKFTLSARGRFMLAAYWGIESSREAIRQGHRVTDAEVEEMLSHMTQEQLEYVNRLWQFNETMAAPLFKAAAQQSGVAPKKLPPAPFTVNGVQMTGGHMRLFYDGVEPMVLTDETPLTAMNTVVPSKAGSAIDRVGSGGRQVDLNTANIFRSLEENAHYIGFSEPSMRLQSVLNNKAVRSAISDTRGVGFYRSLMQNVRGQTTNRPERDAIPMFTRLTNRVRKAKSAMYIMYNIRNIVQQPGTLPMVLDELGPGGYTKAVATFYGNPQGMMEKVNFIRANSAQMNNRRAAMTREAAEIMRDVVNTDPGNRAWAMFKRHGLTPQTIIDLTIAYPLWMARYEQRMTAHGDHDKAVTEADVSVAESIGSGLDIHMGSIFQSNRGAWIKLLTLFGSWANSTMFQRMYRASEGGTNFKTARALNGVVVVPMLTTLMSAALIADWPEEEGEEGFMPWMAKRHGGNMLGLIPVIGDIASYAAGFQPTTATQDAMSLPADIWQTGQRAARGEATATETVEDTTRALGTFLILPGAGNVTRALQAVNEYEEMEDPGDVLRAVLEGSEKNE